MHKPNDQSPSTAPSSLPMDLEAMVSIETWEAFALSQGRDVRTRQCQRTMKNRSQQDEANQKNLSKPLEVLDGEKALDCEEDRYPKKAFGRDQEIAKKADFGG